MLIICFFAHLVSFWGPTWWMIRFWVDVPADSTRRCMVNVHKKLSKITMFHGKTHYFNGNFNNSYVAVYQAGYPRIGWRENTAGHSLAMPSPLNDQPLYQPFELPTIFYCNFQVAVCQPCWFPATWSNNKYKVGIHWITQLLSTIHQHSQPRLFQKHSKTILVPT